MVKLVIFDLDDTLIMEEEYVRSGYKAVSKFLKESFNQKEKNTFNKLLDVKKIKYNEDDILELVQVYRNHIPTISFCEDVMPTLTMLREKNINIGIVTDGYLATQKNKLMVLDAYKIFDYIILTEELGRDYWKPHPKSFEMMMEKFSVSPDEVIYVGDNPKKDFYVKESLNLKTVRIIRDGQIYKNEEYLNGVKENFIISNLKELIMYLN